MMKSMETNKKLYVCAHRGYSSKYPENTLPAFEEAIKVGVDMLEFDLRLSKDNVLMAMHDKTLDRTTNGSGPFADYTYDELRKLDAGIKFGECFEGVKIPTFEEILQLVVSYKDKNYVLLNVEISYAPNDIEACDQAVALIKQYGLIDNIVLNSFDARVVAHAHDVYGLITHGFPGHKMYNFVPGEDGTYSKMWCACLDLPILTVELANEFIGRGIIPWTCPTDNDKDVNYAIECGARCLICNDPLPAMRVIKERGLG
jgi:glycerophosphoryl diester phosphodiesterase